MRSEGFYVNGKSTDTSWDRTSDLPNNIYIYIYNTSSVVIVPIIWLYITVVVVVISCSVIVSCIFMSLLLVTVGIIYSKMDSSVNAVVAHYWKREIYPLEKERCFNIPVGEAELIPNCSRSAKRSNASFLKRMAVTYESDLQRMKLNWEERFTNAYRRSWYL